MAEAGRRFFFVHVMKTGGSTFRRHLEDNFPEPGAVFPDPALDSDLKHANILVQRLLELPATRRAQIRAYTGHFPFVTAALLDPELVTLTMLRDPVERTVSYLKHCKRYDRQFRDMALEEIYEDSFLFPTLIRDHQVKIFAMTSQDKLESYMDVIEIDDERMRTARANLEKADIVGLHERYHLFLDQVRDRLGWLIKDRSPWRVSEEDWRVPASFLRRIAADSPNDLEFYEFARELVQRGTG